MLRDDNRSGFTLVEISVASASAVFVLIAVFSITITCMKAWHRGDVFMRVSHESSMVVEWMVYGVGTNGGLREADGVNILASTDGWTLFYTNASEVACTLDYNDTQNSIVFNPGGKVLSANVIDAPLPVFSNGGVSFAVEVAGRLGRYCSTNRLSTFIKCRNFKG